MEIRIFLLDINFILRYLPKSCAKLHIYSGGKLRIFGEEVSLRSSRGRWQMSVMPYVLSKVMMMKLYENHDPPTNISFHITNILFALSNNPFPSTNISFPSTN